MWCIKIEIKQQLRRDPVISLVICELNVFTVIYLSYKKLNQRIPVENYFIVVKQA